MRKDKSKKKKKERNWYFVKTRNISASIYFILMIAFILMVFLTYFGVIDFGIGIFNFGG